MISTTSKWLALAAGLALGASGVVQAQDNTAILDALVRKGILSTEEAAQIAADAKASAAVNAAPGSKSVSNLSITGRVQAQFNLVETDADNAADGDTFSRFSMRRVRLGATADFGPDFRGVISYDLVSNNLDVAYVRWLQSPDFTVDAGFRKVNFGFEENTSSSRLKSIERSPVTRFFVEDNNGRRLGAGSRRTGLFADGKAGDFFYGAAITNLERQANPGSSPAAGNNSVALWLNGGVKGKRDNGTYTFGASLGYLPEQVASGAGNGYAVGVNDGALLVASVYGDVTAGDFGLTGELLWSDNDAAVGANSWGVWIQPSYKLSKQLELVGRFSHLDTDGIGTRVSDVVPGGTNPAGNPGFESVNEFYAGMNYYFKGADVKFSAGVFLAQFDDQIGGAGDVSAEATGLRTQMQVNF